MIGILLDNLSQSQLVCEIDRSVRATKLPVTVYVKKTTPPWRDPPFPVSNWADAWGAKFPLVATDLDSAFHLVRFPAVPRKYFYLNDLEWLRHHKWGGPPPYHALASIYRHPDLTLLSRGESHKRAVDEAFNVSSLLCNQTSLVEWLYAEPTH